MLAAPGGRHDEGEYSYKKRIDDMMSKEGSRLLVDIAVRKLRVPVDLARLLTYRSRSAREPFIEPSTPQWSTYVYACSSRTISWFGTPGVAITGMCLIGFSRLLLQDLRAFDDELCDEVHIHSCYVFLCLVQLRWTRWRLMAW